MIFNTKSYIRENRLGSFIFVLSLLILILGYLNLHGTTAKYIVQDFYANFGAELLSIALTVSIIDHLAERRQEQELKEQLIQDLEGKSNDFSLRALARLRSKGWLTPQLFEQVDLRGANLSGADLSGISISHKDLQEIILEGANLIDVNFSRCTLIRANLSRANLQNSDFSSARLVKSNICKANLSHADLSSATLADADLIEVNLYGCCAQRCDFRGANLQNANLRDADLKSARLDNSNLEGADLSTADLSEASLEFARYDNRTRFPRTFDPKNSGAIYKNPS